MEKKLRHLELDDACIVSTGIYMKLNRNSNKFQHAEDVIYNPINPVNPDSKPQLQAPQAPNTPPPTSVKSLNP